MPSSAESGYGSSHATSLLGLPSGAKATGGPSSSGRQRPCARRESVARHMGQAVWSGSITFGLVNIPVRLYPATQPKDVRFHLYDRRTGKRVRYERVTRADEAATFAPDPAFAPRSGDSQAESLPATRSARESVRESARGAQPIEADEVVRGVELPEGDFV